MKNIGIFLLFAGIPLIAGDAAGTGNANRGGPSVEKRNLSNAEVQSTLKALGISAASPSSVIQCDVENSQGTVTNTVTAAHYPGSPVYWLRYQPGSDSAKQVHFTITPLFRGSPLAAQVQVFSPNSNSEILTPFEIPFWENALTSGPWVLVVQNDLGHTASFNFTVQ